MYIDCFLNDRLMLSFLLVYFDFDTSFRARYIIPENIVPIFSDYNPSRVRVTSVNELYDGTIFASAFI